VLVASGILVYLLFGNRIFGAGSTGEAVIDAQQAITEASARVDSLPKDHPLRAYLPQLAEWQGELRAYQEVQEYNAQIVEKAERYQKKAEDISSQARAALAASPREPANSSPAPVGLPANASATPKPAEQTEAEPEDPDAEEEEEGEPEAQNKNSSGAANKNAPKGRRPDPPVIDPVKPVPADPRPSNSNKPKNNNPPVTDRVNQDGHSN
jgi:hypothetical protein